MKLAIALLIGWAISASATTSARAAELPSRQAPTPTETAKTCTIDGAPGVELAGGGTCFRIKGALSAQVSAGSPLK